MPESFIEVRLRGPLRDLTRKERRSLVAASATAIGLVKTGWVPTEGATPGTIFTAADQSALLKVLAGIVAYFLTRFVIYAISDWLSIRRAPPDVKSKLDELRKEIEERLLASGATLRKVTTPILAVRSAFEFAVPLAIGGYALISLAKVW